MIQQRGYTLIELLLVTTVLSLLASLAITTYRHYWIERHLEKAAIEMENVLAAALNYHNDHDAWPLPNDIIHTCSTTPGPDDEFAKNYLPNHLSKNSFGSYYCWGTTGEAGALFWVALEIPNGQDPSFRQRIAAKLPNAHVVDDPQSPSTETCGQTSCYVKAEIAGASSGRTSTTIVGVGNCVAGTTTQGSVEDLRCQYIGQSGREPKTVEYAIQFHCPNTLEKEVMATVNNLDVGKANGDPYVLRTLSFEADCKDTAGCSLKINAARSDGISVATGAHGHIGASYIAYCQPNKQNHTHTRFSQDE